MTKRKSYYPQFKKAATTIADILINHDEHPVCVKCRKDLSPLRDGGCADRAIKGFGKGKKDFKAFSGMPFGFISNGFVDTPYSLLCYECDSTVKRMIGYIPEIYNSDYFPQVSSTGVDIDDFFDSLKSKKKTKWQIRYKKKTVPHTKVLKAKFMNEAVKAYKKKFPECPHTESKLKRLINGYKLYDKLYERW